METDVVETGVRAQRRDKSRGWPGSCRGGNQSASGMAVIQVLVRNMGTCHSDIKGERQGVEYRSRAQGRTIPQ